MPGRGSGATSGEVPDLDPGPAPAAFPEEGTALGLPRTSLPRAAAWVGPATALANVLGYVFNLVLSRRLGPASYGELGALLGLSLIALVPALAVQPVVARLVVLAPPARLPGLVRAALWVGARVGLGTAAVVILSLPVTTAMLRLDRAPVLWLAASLAPAAVLTAAQGVLQGLERFRSLAVVFVAAAAARLIGAVVGVALLHGVSGALAGSAIGAVAAALLAVVLAGTGSARDPLPDHVRRQLITAAVALLGLLVLGNVDVLLARARLTPADAGLYAVGAVVAKAGFWGPQFVQVIVFTRLAEDSRQRLLGRSLAVVAGGGFALVLGCALLGSSVVRLAFGARYAALGGSVWVFAATGSVLAVAQLLLYARLAAADARLAVAVGVIVVAEVAVVLLVHASTPRQVALVALGAASLLAATAAVLQWRPAAARLNLTASGDGGDAG